MRIFNVIRKNSIEEKGAMEDAVKSYLNPHDRFAARMKASMGSKGTSPKGSNAEEGDGEQNKLFVEDTYIDDSK